MKELIKQKLRKNNQERLEICNLLRSYLQDKSVDLDERWELYVEVCESSDYVNVYPWILELKTHNLLQNPDMLHRGEEIYLYLSVEGIEDEIDEYPDLDLNALKEEILQSGYSSFIYDW